ncbi:MAG: hypothetical protein M0R06_00315 [Sphaerochaeta sp.]|jgi:hypothetical protein|nr:hypothetical protein [Sphaerochaeta sp.]
MERWKQDLDSYITGGRYHRWTDTIKCKSCGHQWEAEFFTEYGMTNFLNDGDAVCPECDEYYEE